MIQGYVGHSKPTMDIDLILISRRRWLMGGTRYNARGVDDEGNAANFVESEQLVVRTKYNKETDTKKVSTYSFTQLRGSIPFHWTQLDGKIKMDRSIEASTEVFLKHTDSILNDYESDRFLMINLLARQQAHEENLTVGLRRLLEETTPILSKRGKRIDYDYFDFHYEYKRGGGTVHLETYINEQLRNLYLRDIGLFQENAAFNYSDDM